MSADVVEFRIARETLAIYRTAPFLVFTGLLGARVAGVETDSAAPLDDVYFVVYPLLGAWIIAPLIPAIYLFVGFLNARRFRIVPMATGLTWSNRFFSHQRVAWQDIRQILVTQTDDGRIFRVDLVTEKRYLDTFRDLANAEDFVRSLVERTGKSPICQRGRNWFTWGTVLTAWILFIAAMPLGVYLLDHFYFAV